MLQEWPDALHIAVLRHLGGPRHIEGFLWPYSTLCTACAAASRLPPLWRDLDFSDGRATSLGSVGILGLLRRYGRGVVERLVLRGLDSVDDSLVLGVAELFSPGPLRVLDLGGCPRISGSALPACGGIPTLEELGAECIASLEDQHVEQLCSRCPALKRLDVRFCEALTNIAVFSRRPGGWKALQLDGCFRLNVAQMFRVSTPGAWAGLQELSLDGEDLETEQLALISSTFVGLRRLTVSFARELDAPVLQGLAELRHMESLTLRKATQPTDADWAAFFATQRSTWAEGGRAPPACEQPVDCGVSVGVDAVHTGGCVGRGDDMGVGQPWRLLNVAECEHFADGAALSLAASSLPNLREIDLSWCWHLTDSGLSALLGAAQGLLRVKLAGMKGVTASGIAPCCRMPGLVELDCTSCNSVADGMLEFLHRLFAGPPGTGDCHALPPGVLPPLVTSVAQSLWRRRSRGARALQVKNYYAEYIEDWGQMRPLEEVCDIAEQLLAQARLVSALDLGPMSEPCALAGPEA